VTIKSSFFRSLFIIIIIFIAALDGQASAGGKSLDERLDYFDFALGEEVYKLRYLRPSSWNDVFYIDFLPEVATIGKSDHRISVRADVVKALSGHVVFRRLQYHSLWTSGFTKDIPEIQIQNIARSYMNFTNALMEWEWGSPSNILDPALTSFIGRLEHHFRQYEPLLKLEKLLPEKLALIFDYFPLERRLMVRSSIVVLFSPPFGGSLVVIPGNEERLLGQYDNIERGIDDDVVAELAKRAFNAFREKEQEIMGPHD